MEDKILLKIKKTLELAERAGSEEEANTALKLAQEMMLKYSVNHDDINGISDNEIIQKVYNPEARRTPKHTSMISLILKDHFPIEIMTTLRTGLYSRILVIGKKTDCEYFCIMLDSVVRQYTKKLNPACEEYLNRLAKSVGDYDYFAKKRILSDSVKKEWRTNFKNSYLNGYLSGLDKTFTENEVEKGLIVITPDAVIKKQAAIATGGKKVIKNHTTIESGYESGFESGIESGRNYKKMRLNSPAV